MIAYVLAAGYGTRLASSEGGVAKPLLTVGGAPVLTHLVDALASLEEVEEIVLVSNHRFVERFAEWADAYRPDASHPVHLLDDGTSTAAERLGANRDLAFALHRVPPGNRPFVVSAADYVPLFHMVPLAADFRAGRRPLLVLRRVATTGEPASAYGRSASGRSPSAGRYNEVTLEEGRRVVRFREKPPDGNRTGVAAIPLYFFTPEVAKLVPRYLEGGGEPDAPGHFVSWLVERTAVRGAFLDGTWLDVGNPESLERARRRMGKS